MKQSMMALVLGVLVGLCEGASPAPFSTELATVDDLFRATRMGELRALATDSLIRIVMGKPETIDSAFARRASIRPDPALGWAAYRNASVRARALRKLGETGLPEVTEFLSGLNQEDLGEDSSQQLWPAVQIAIHESIVRQLASRAERTGYLEAVLTSTPNSPWRNSVRYWAANKLCDNGSILSMPVVQKTLRDVYSGNTAEEEIAFCETRVRVVSADSDRVNAIATVLRLTNAPVNQRLVGWAVSQMESENTDEATQVLERFANDIHNLPTGSAIREALVPYEREIRDRDRRRLR